MPDIVGEAAIARLRARNRPLAIALSRGLAIIGAVLARPYPHAGGWLVIRGMGVLDAFAPRDHEPPPGFSFALRYHVDIGETKEDKSHAREPGYLGWDLRCLRMTLTINIDENRQKYLENEARLIGKSLEEYATELLTQTSSVNKRPKEPRRLGWAAGRGLWISDDFDEPLEEFKDYM